MDWNTLLSVFLGGLLATVPIIISNRFQAKEHEKERLEQRRITKIQAREKWEERDILEIIELVEKLLKDVSEIKKHVSIVSLRSAKNKDPLTVDEFIKRVELSAGNLVDQLLECKQTTDKLAWLAHSFDDTKILSGYVDFTLAAFDVIGLTPSTMDDKTRKSEVVTKPLPKMSESDSWGNLLICAGVFHEALREKLISLRDS